MLHRRGKKHRSLLIFPQEVFTFQKKCCTSQSLFSFCLICTGIKQVSRVSLGQLCEHLENKESILATSEGSTDFILNLYKAKRYLPS